MMRFAWQSIFWGILVMAGVVSCASPSGGPSSDAANPPSNSGPVSSAPSPSSPSWVKAEYVKKSGSGVVLVTWDPVAPSYELYRRLGAGDWTRVASPAESSYADTEYYQTLPAVAKPQPVQYAIRSVSGSAISGFSVSSNPTAPVVLDAQASLLSYPGKIHLSWTLHSEAETYQVYRYSSVTEGSSPGTPVRTNITPTQAALGWEDIPLSGSDPKPDQPYYYRVTWVKEGQEYGTEGPLAVGAYSTLTDLYESVEHPNDDWPSLPSDPSLFNNSQPPLSYSFADGMGGTVRDSDWYKCLVPAGTSITVKITLPEATDFRNGELKLRFFCNGIDYPANSIDQGPTGNSFIFSPENGSEDQTLYFHIEPDSTISENKIGSYTVTVSNDLS